MTTTPDNPASPADGRRKREWLVIENSSKRSPFFDGDPIKGFIPRDIVENELGIKLKPDGQCTWFTLEDGARMRAHPEWREGSDPEFAELANV